MSKAARTAVVVGASSGVGRALAEELARRGWRLVLAAQDVRDLEALACDLNARWQADALPIALDLSPGDFDAPGFRDACLRALGPIDAVLAVAGYVDDDDCGLADDETLVRISHVNYLSTVRLLAAFAKTFKAQGRGVLVGFSSIAAASPRRRNLVYASAKAGLEAYLRALRHYFAGTPVLVQGYGSRPSRPPVISPSTSTGTGGSSFTRDIGACSRRF
jgi:short-subunit dehydrogenase